MKQRPKKFTRREAMTHLSAGSLLALGLWPGCVSAPETHAGSFRFLVINDTHYLSPECGTWLEGVIRHMKTHEQAEFCLLAGDLTEHGRREDLAAVRDIFAGLGLPTYVVIGNHDYLTRSDHDRQAYEELFPRRINYLFKHRGWQFIGLDTSEGLLYEGTTIHPSTFRWLDEHLPKLNQKQPTVIFTHFPLGPNVTYRPKNADDLLDRFRPFNLQAVFSGHFHGFTERQVGGVVLTTNRCCALKRGNHDKTTEKGYFLCTANEGKVSRTFIQYKPA